MSEHVVEITTLSLISHVENLGLRRLDLTGFSNCTLRFSDCKFARPIAMMYLAEEFRRLRRRFPRVAYRILTRDNQFRGYADHIGFFRFLGFPRGNRPGQVAGGMRYVPIELINLNRIRDDASNGVIGPLVKSRAIKMAKVLSQSESGVLFDLFEYTLREVLRNSAEHSRGSVGVVMGQYWPREDLAQIVIADNGVGIAENLYESEMVECNTNLQALKFSILPGVTGVSLDARQLQDDHWGNSGFGLYLTSRVCSEEGFFTIISGPDAIQLAHGSIEEHKWSYGGTLVAMQFKVSSAARMISKLDDLIFEGGKENKELLRDYPISPSRASKMLASHFERAE